MQVTTDDLSALAFAFVIGSIPFGLIFGLMFWHTDLREEGSHNIGATNAYRVLGWPAALLTFIFDFGKGIIAIICALYISNNVDIPVFAAIASIAGHCYSIFLKGKGGKGVATSLGCLFFLMPDTAGCLLIVWGLCIGMTRIVSVASCLAAICAPIIAAAFGYQIDYVLFTGAASIAVLIRHKDNIKRLFEGSEFKM